MEGSTLVENERYVTGLGTLGRSCALWVNWSYVHKENVDKQNPIKKSIMGDMYSSRKKSE